MTVDTRWITVGRLLAIAVLALALAGLLAVAVPGFMSQPAADPPEFTINEVTLESDEITGETATLNVTLLLERFDGSADNVTLVVRAVDSSSGLLVDETTQSVTAAAPNTEVPVTATVTVPREGGYELRSVLYADGQRIESARTSVDGVAALTPPYATSTITFAEFAYRPAVEYTVLDAGDEHTTLEVTSYLTNTGDQPRSDLELEVIARHAEAGVVADRTRTPVEPIDPGRTVPITTTIQVPSETNYYLDATLWRDDVVIGSTRGAANLDPQRTVSVDTKQEDVGFNAEDFETDRRRPTAEDDASSRGATPGVGTLGALIALLSAAALATHRRRNP